LNLLGSFVAHVGATFLASGSFWLPESASTASHEVDKMFGLIFWISVFFFSLIVALMLFFVIRYRRRDENESVQESPHDHMGLELTWSIIPIIIVIIIFYMGFKGYMHLSVAPRDAYEVLVTGQKWSWKFTYPNGAEDGDLHVPAGKNIRLVMRSEDVIHSVYIPAFRIKKDVVPGRYTKTWFNAPEPGVFDLVCAEYCGTSHSDMRAKVIVLSQAEFDKWLELAGGFLDKLPPVEAGKRVSEIQGCVQCHTEDGTRKIGPSYLGLFGSTRTLKDGSTVVVDEDYIRESILDPFAKIAEGYDPVMPTFQGRISDQEITVIIEYLKSLSE
jgi:cytochrome c oxidase subunit 2